MSATILFVGNQITKTLSSSGEKELKQQVQLVHSMMESTVDAVEREAKRLLDIYAARYPGSFTLDESAEAVPILRHNKIVVNEHAESVERLIHAADLAMYQVKQSGRANYQFYTPDLDVRADAVFKLESRLKAALKNDRLALHYQPVIDVKSGKLISAEALVRLPDDGGEPTGPAIFIPIAESTGLIGALGDWVAVEACHQHVAWRVQGLSIPIAINVSPLQFRQRGFPERLGKIIADAKVDPAGLQLEVTETTVMESDDTATDILLRIKALARIFHG